MKGKRNTKTGNTSRNPGPSLPKKAKISTSGKPAMNTGGNAYAGKRQFAGNAK